MRISCNCQSPSPPISISRQKWEAISLCYTLSESIFFGSCICVPCNKRGIHRFFAQCGCVSCLLQMSASFLAAPVLHFLKKFESHEDASDVSLKVRANTAWRNEDCLVVWFCVISLLSWTSWSWGTDEMGTDTSISALNALASLGGLAASFESMGASMLLSIILLSKVTFDSLLYLAACVECSGCDFSGESSEKDFEYDAANWEGRVSGADSVSSFLSSHFLPRSISSALERSLFAWCPSFFWVFFVSDSTWLVVSLESFSEVSLVVFIERVTPTQLWGNLFSTTISNASSFLTVAIRNLTNGSNTGGALMPPSFLVYQRSETVSWS